jgi:hypothetical protein
MKLTSDAVYIGEYKIGKCYSWYIVEHDSGPPFIGAYWFVEQTPHACYCSAYDSVTTALPKWVILA